MSKQIVRQSRFEQTDHEARLMIKAETDAREKKTAKLKALREANEADQPIAAPVTPVRRKRKPRQA